MGLSLPNVLVSLSIVGFHGDPDFLNKASKHLSRTKATGKTRFCNSTGKDRVISLKCILGVLLTCLCGLPEVPGT